MQNALSKFAQIVRYIEALLYKRLLRDFFKVLLYKQAEPVMTGLNL